MKTENNINNNFWMFPWKYKQSFVIIFVFIFVGFALEFFTKGTIKALSFPVNIYTLLSVIIISLVLYFTTKNTAIWQWLKSPFLAIATISSLLFLIILMGSFPQNELSSIGIVNILSLNNIAFSYPFLFVLLFFLTNLLFVILYKFSSFSLKNILFALNHIGIYITTVALIFSVGDIQKHTLRIDKDNYLYTINKIELPFALRLIDFQLDLFAPKIAIVDNTKDEILTGNANIISVDSDSTIFFNNNRIKVLKWLPKSVKQAGEYYFVNDVGYTQSALIEIADENNLITTKWVSCGSFVYPSEQASIDSNYTIVMLDPEPKSFKSEILVHYKTGESEKVEIEVNKPVNINGWDIYQTDYNKEMGTWSDYSIIEMVKDPWLPVVYTGIAMLIFGAVMLMFIGKKE